MCSRLLKIVSLTVFALLSFGAKSAQAVATINFDGGVVATSSGVPLPTGHLMYLISLGPSGVFTPLQAGEWAGAGNYKIADFWYTDDGVLDAPGGFSTMAVVDLSGGVAAGQQFGFLWFPTLTGPPAPLSPPTAGTSYGFYTHSSYIIPADGNVENFSFETVSIGGTIPDSAGWASYVVIPEPHTYALVACGLGALLIARKRRKVS